MTPETIAALVIGTIGWMCLLKVVVLEPVTLMARERRARQAQIEQRRRSVPIGRRSFSGV